jgi:hypothetical protein
LLWIPWQTVEFVCVAAGQEIHSDPENILIRTLLMRKDRTLGNKGKQQEKGKAADKGKGKRPAETAAGACEAKRAHCDASGSGNAEGCKWKAWACTLTERAVHRCHLLATGEGGSGQSASAVIYLADQLRSKTNQELVDILKSRGLAGRGKKEELVQRILEAQDRSRRSGQR